MDRIWLWIPAAESPRWPCVESWWSLERPDNTELKLIRSGANNIKYSWNAIVKEFLDSGDEWLLSWHNDITGDSKTLMRLLSWDKPLVSALVFMRQSPVVPHVWKTYEGSDRYYTQRINDTRNWFYVHSDWVKFGPFVMEPKPDDALVEVDFTSTSCTLINRKVLEDMREEVKDEWFKWDNDYTGGGEDRNFFQHAKLAGYQGYVDRSCVA